MLNLLKLEDTLKGLPDDVLARYMLQPAPDVPQFMVMSELMRRKKMRDEYAARPVPETSIADEMRQGIMSMAQSEPAGMRQPQQIAGYQVGGPIDPDLVKLKRLYSEMLNAPNATAAQKRKAQMELNRLRDLQMRWSLVPPPRDPVSVQKDIGQLPYPRVQDAGPLYPEGWHLYHRTGPFQDKDPAVDQFRGEAMYGTDPLRNQPEALPRIPPYPSTGTTMDHSAALNYDQIAGTLAYPHESLSGLPRYKPLPWYNEKPDTGDYDAIAGIPGYPHESPPALPSYPPAGDYGEFKKNLRKWLDDVVGALDEMTFGGKSSPDKGKAEPTPLAEDEDRPITIGKKPDTQTAADVGGGGESESQGGIAGRGGGGESESRGGIAGLGGGNEFQLAGQIAKFAGYEPHRFEKTFDRLQDNYEALRAEIEGGEQQDKYMALAQFGAALASGTSPYFAENFGKAASAGIESLQGARRDMLENKLRLLGIDADIMNARAAAAMNDTDAMIKFYAAAADKIAMDRKLALASSQKSGLTREEFGKSVLDMYQALLENSSLAQAATDSDQPTADQLMSAAKSMVAQAYGLVPPGSVMTMKEMIEHEKVRRGLL